MTRSIRLRVGDVLIVIEESILNDMGRAVDEFLGLRDIVTEMWGEGSVLGEFRRDRRHV